MGKRLGVIAGSGEFPIHVCQRAREMGFLCVAAAIKGQADKPFARMADDIAWFEVHEIGNLIGFFKEKGVSEAVFAGKIDPLAVFKNEELQNTLTALQGSEKKWTPADLIQTAIEIFSAQGIAIEDPTPFIASAYCEEGVLTETKPSADAEEAIRFGWDIARKLADLDIGQTVIVKNRAIVAVEGMEGTDKAILRAGELVGKGTIVVKVGRSSQDPRIDLPAVGLKTVESLVRAGGQALGFEAKSVPFFQKEKALSLANAHGLSIIAR